jgi:hypothetical protein
MYYRLVVPLFLETQVQIPCAETGCCGELHVLRLTTGQLVIVCEHCSAGWDSPDLSHEVIAPWTMLNGDEWTYASYEDIDRAGWPRSRFHYSTFAEETKRP